MLTKGDKLITDATLSEDQLNNLSEGKSLRTTNVIQEQLLVNILKELKIMNMHYKVRRDRGANSI
jgi:hypothetical protein